MKRLLFLFFLVNASLGWAQILSVRPVPDLAKGFMMGADVSMLDQLESLGAKYYDENGKPSDCLALLKAGGVNWIRLRVWNDPVTSAGEPLGGGNDDLAAYIRVAKRAKNLGLKVLADFHYSDFWADPSKQTIPFAWKGMNLGDLKKALYAYTKTSLKQMQAAGASPDLVQVGNEVDGGFLWPAGKIWASAGETIGGEKGFISLLKEAIRAVRETDRKIKIMVHLSNGGDNALYRKFFDPLVQNGVDFDVIGLSFYPYWHGKIADLAANMADLASRYGKQLIVAETAYAWTLEPGDSLANSFGPGSDKLGGYKATVQGQATALADVIAAVAEVPGSKGLGVFYWEPDWLPIPGAGWRTGDGNSWENQALFDYKGKALPSLKIFKLVSGKGEIPDLAVTSVEDVQVKVAVGNVLELPKLVLATYNDDSFRSVQVRWDVPEASAWSKVGKLAIKGSVWGFKPTVTAYVDVVADVNLISDSSFESGSLSADWVLSGEGAQAATVEKNPGNAHTGNYSFKYWLDKPFRFVLSRTLKGLKDGTYSFRGWAAGSGGEKDYHVFVRNYGGPELSVKVVDTGWQKWQLYEIKGIVVKGGVCEVGLSMDATAGNWGNFDDVEFIRDAD